VTRGRRVAACVALLTIVGCSSHDTATTRTTLLATSTTTASPNSTDVGPSTSTTTTVEPARLDLDLGASELAAELTDVERAAGRGDAGVGARQQLLYRYLSAHAELDEAVLTSIGDDVRPYVERIVHARQFSQQRAADNPNPTPPSDTLPAWTIVDPAPAEELLADYHAAEQAKGIAWYWLAAIHLQETRMGRIVGTSSAGAVGPMQFLPTTWAACCTGDPTVTRDAIIGAATYLAANGGPGDMHAALHAYNPSDSYITTVTAYADNLRDNPNLFAAYRQWQVFYSSSAGTIRLPVGYHELEPVDAAAYAAGHPEDRAG
jgi:membrane-bound lytic murein transglycosylase B